MTDIVSEKKQLDITTSIMQRSESDFMADSEKQMGEFDIYIDPELEKRTVRKIDRNVLPILCLFYFYAALDRSNIGNAATAGLTDAISLTSSQYSNAVTLFFVTYILSELPAALLLKILRPSRLLSLFVFCWAAVCIGMTFVSLYWSLLLCRLLLGAFEGGYFPCITIYVTGIAGYNKQEQGLRIAILLLCAALSGAVGGLISYGFVQVHTPHLEGFRFIFLVEGLITIVCVPILFFWLPNDITTAKFLKEEEREVMRLRKKQREKYMSEEVFEWEQVFIAMKDVRTYLSMIIQFCQDTILYGFSTFLPSILKLGLGYGKLEAQYLTIPVYFVSAVGLLSLCIWSDRVNLRGPFIFGTNILGIIGYILMIACKNNSVKYFATYLIAFPLYIGPTLNLAWTSNNMAPYYRKTTAIGCNQTLGNISGAIAGQVYRSSPYVLGNSFSLGCLVVSCICVVLNTWRLKQLNKEKEEVLSGSPDPKTNRTGDRALDFVYCY